MKLKRPEEKDHHPKINIIKSISSKNEDQQSNRRPSNQSHHQINVSLLLLNYMTLQIDGTHDVQG